MKKLQSILISCLIFCFACALFGACVPSFAVTNADASFDKVDVLEDLNNSSIEGKPFSASDYPANADGALQIINFVEYGYAENAAHRAAYALYIYVYNPAKINIRADSGQNRVQLATAFDAEGNPTDYEKFDLALCSATADGLFYKYKIIDHIAADGLSMAERVTPAARRYEVSGIELLTRYEQKVTDYPIGKAYTFTGYAKGLSEESADAATLRVSSRIAETIELSVNHTNFLTAYSGYNFSGTQRNIQSIYFAVDNEKIERYGYLYSIKMIWEQYISAPILVIDDADLFARISRFSGAVIPASVDVTKPSELKEALENAGYADVPSTINLRFYTYLGASALFEHGNFRVIAPIVFYTNGESRTTFTVTADELLEYMESYDKTFVDGKITVAGKTFSLDLFSMPTTYDPHVEKVVELGDNFDVEAVELQANHDKLINLFYDKAPTGAEYADIKPIEELTLDKLNESGAYIDLFINQKDMADIKSYVTAANADNKTVYIVRYDVSTEYAGYFSVLGSDPGGYVELQNQYLGFDIIWLTLYDDVSYTTLPVVADPVNIVNDITAPPYITATPDKTNWELIIKIIVIVVLVIIALAVFMPIIGPVLGEALKLLFKGIVWLILAPFKAIRAIYERAKK